MKSSIIRRLFILAFIFCLCAACASRAFSAESRQINYSNFSVTLPPGWDGDEQSGFISDDKEEYALTLGRKDENGDNFLAQITIYLLPNKPGAANREAANILAQSQADATTPQQEGVFYTFEGEPRTRTVKGKAKTYVNSDHNTLLIIIAQDPQNLGAKEIVASLKGISPRAKKLLGQDNGHPESPQNQ